MGAEGRSAFLWPRQLLCRKFRGGPAGKRPGERPLSLPGRPVRAAGRGRPAHPCPCRRRTKIEKEKKEHAKLHGMIRTEISGAEIAEEMEKERRFFQLQMCEVSEAGRGGPAAAGA